MSRELQNKRTRRTAEEDPLPEPTPRLFRPKFKNIKLEPFTGSRSGPAIEAYLRRFEAAEETDVLLNESVWDNEIRKAILVAKLEGEAAKWLDGKRLVKQTFDFPELKKWLLDRYGCTDTCEQIREQIRTLRKKGNQTWGQYADALLQLSYKTQTDVMDTVLTTFCENAEPKYTANLKQSARLEGPGQSDIQDLVSLLTKLTNHDGTRGVRVSRTNFANNPQQRNSRTNFANNPQQKYNKSFKGKKSKKDLKCSFCNKRFHEEKDCRLLEKARKMIGSANTESSDFRKGV